MQITVNGEIKKVAGTTLADLLNEMGYDAAKVATAVNEGFVPAGARADHTLRDGDRVEIVAPKQGG